MNEWVKNESKTADFGDKRLNDRYSKILDKTSERPFETLPGALTGHSELISAYRFMDNDKVTFQNVLKPHSDAALERAKQEEVILAVQDTTSLDYSKSKSRDKLGFIDRSYMKGFLIHPTILFSDQAVCHGVYSAKIWSRKIEDVGKRHKRKMLPIEEKESFRWIESYLSACEIANKYPDKTVVSVGDREFDIYESFVEALKEENNAELLMRASQNRRTLNDDNEISLLWESFNAVPEKGEIELKIPRAHEREARTTTISIKYQTVTLKVPEKKKKKLPDVKIQAVLFLEKEPPEGSDPIEWLILTTLKVSTIEEAITILKYYKIRWQIEIYFRILKSGCKVEELQLEEKERLEPCIALYMSIAWRVLFLVMLGRSHPDIGSDTVFEEAEWKITCIMSTKKKPPEKAPKLKELIIMIAIFGGYLNRKGDGDPGPKHLWIGLRRLADFTLAYKQMHNL